MYSRNIQLPTDKSFFLFGPRATGKTSLIKFRYPDALYLDLLDFQLYQKLLSDPSRLREMIPSGFDNYIVIDEVQRVPELLNEVHRAIESPAHHRFILTGSSARKLRRQGTNLLAGRALTYHLHPLSADEMADDFDIKDALTHGSLPAIFQETDKEKYLHSYVETYLRKNYARGLTRNLSGFSRFLEIASFPSEHLSNFCYCPRCNDWAQSCRKLFSILKTSCSLFPPILPRAKKACCSSKILF